MKRASGLVVVLAVALLFGGLLSGDEKKKKTKAKGTLPIGWTKLKLTSDQKDRIFKVQGDYRKRIKDVKDQIKMLRAKQKQLQDEVKEKMLDVLTTEQKKRLFGSSSNKDSKVTGKDKKGKKTKAKDDE
jgi:hypothetical protein